MSRLILINAEKLCEYANNLVSRSVDANDIMRFPRVDAVEIVRCKECVHLQKSGQCDKTSLWVGTKEDGGNDDFFCGYGERRNINDENFLHHT